MIRRISSFSTLTSLLLGSFQYAHASPLSELEPITDEALNRYLFVEGFDGVEDVDLDQQTTAIRRRMYIEEEEQEMFDHFDQMEQKLKDRIQDQLKNLERPGMREDTEYMMNLLEIVQDLKIEAHKMRNLVHQWINNEDEFGQEMEESLVKQQETQSRANSEIGNIDEMIQKKEQYLEQRHSQVHSMIGLLSQTMGYLTSNLRVILMQGFDLNVSEKEDTSDEGNEPLNNDEQSDPIDVPSSQQIFTDMPSLMDTESPTFIDQVTSSPTLGDLSTSSPSIDGIKDLDDESSEFDTLEGVFDSVNTNSPTSSPSLAQFPNDDQTSELTESPSQLQSTEFPRTSIFGTSSPNVTGFPNITQSNENITVDDSTSVTDTDAPTQGPNSEVLTSQADWTTDQINPEMDTETDTDTDVEAFDDATEPQPSSSQDYFFPSAQINEDEPPIPSELENPESTDSPSYEIISTPESETESINTEAPDMVASNLDDPTSSPSLAQFPNDDQTSELTESPSQPQSTEFPSTSIFGTSSPNATSFPNITVDDSTSVTDTDAPTQGPNAGVPTSQADWTTDQINPEMDAETNTDTDIEAFDDAIEPQPSSSQDYFFPSAQINEDEPPFPSELENLESTDSPSYEVISTPESGTDSINTEVPDMVASDLDDPNEWETGGDSIFTDYTQIPDDQTVQINPELTDSEMIPEMTPESDNIMSDMDTNGDEFVTLESLLNDEPQTSSPVSSPSQISVNQELSEEQLETLPFSQAMANDKVDFGTQTDDLDEDLGI